jgi:hypothetical protein
MTVCTVREVGLRRDTEIVQDIFLAQALLVVGIQKFPGPVLGFMDLFCRLGMALDADLCNVRSALEMTLQFLEFCVVCSRNPLSIGNSRKKNCRHANKADQKAIDKIKPERFHRACLNVCDCL